MDIKEALMSLDALDDDQWTQDGSPKLDAISELVGRKVSRQEIIDAAPGFSRENMQIEEAKEEAQEGAHEEVQEEEAAEPDLDALKEMLKNDPLPERKSAEFVASLGKETLPYLEKVLIEQLEAAEEAIALAQDLKGRLKVSLAQTKSRIKAEIPDMSHQEAIQAYLERQKEVRAMKSETSRKILDGINISDLDPRAAIDRAMARKNNRGAGRPTRPMK